MDLFSDEFTSTDDYELSEIDGINDELSLLSISEFSDDLELNDIYKDKNDVVWTPIVPVNTKITKENIMKNQPGVTAYASSRICNLSDCFLLFLNDEFDKTVISNTNKYGNYHYGKKWKPLCTSEFKAYLGILIYMAIFKSKMESLKQLWSINKGREIFRKIMPLTRFTQINRSIHFDDFQTRETRKENDKLCYIRDVFDNWKKILPMCLIPNSNLTVDEQLVAFRGRCSFKQYMPSKPAVYGIKFFLLTEPITNYTHNISIYVGKNNNDKNSKNVGENVVMELCSYLKGTGRNIVCDNFFTSISLGKKLLNINLTLLGTLRHNKRDIPPILKPNKTKEVFSSIFIFNCKNMLLSYVPKKNKAVILLATSSTNTNITDNISKKPEVIIEYNKTKGAVDTVDRILSMTSVKRYTKRWPMESVFGTIS